MPRITHPPLGIDGSPVERRWSVFDALGFQATVNGCVAEVQALYLEDKTPWIVGYSGGKDSSATLQIVWMALAALPPSSRHKPVHVISTDTLVENPIVAAWASDSLVAMRRAATTHGLPILAHRLTPALEDSFWVNLLGHGYPAPRHKFRWCTERLKIRPSNTFILGIVEQSREAILVLGTRKAESQVRRARMEKAEGRRVRERLSPNEGLPGTLVYSPIEDWSNDDVWMFLMQVKNPWDWDNKALLTLYQGATEGGECPLVVDTSTPSCGSSRFGCWVCTLVDQDLSMTAMIQNDADKEWMLPLLELRNALDFRNGEDGDRHLRDFRRKNGTITLHRGRAVHGPYHQAARSDWLRRVLEAQMWIRRHGPAFVRSIELVSLAELDAIRRIWVFDKHEMEDVLPALYTQVTGDAYPGTVLGARPPFGAEEMELLREAAGGDAAFKLAREILGVEARAQALGQRAGRVLALEQVFARHLFASEEEAVRVTQEQVEARARLALLPLVAASPWPTTATRQADAVKTLGKFRRMLGDEGAAHVVEELIATVTDLAPSPEIARLRKRAKSPTRKSP